MMVIAASLFRLSGDWHARPRGQVVAAPPRSV